MKPALVLHIGHAKTGTTAIQNALTGAAQDLLRDHGVLYPIEGKQYNHTLLVPHLLGDNVGLRRLEQRLGSPERMTEAAKRYWKRIKAQVQRTRPRLVVLSSETLFRSSDKADFQQLSNLLAEISDDVSVLGYLREPAYHAISSMQQQLKWYGTFNLGWPGLLRKVIESYEATFADGCQFAIFDRDRLAGNDIVMDFAMRALPAGAAETLARHKQASANETMSAEAMSILQDFNAARLARGEKAHMDQAASRFRRAVLKKDRAVPEMSRPRMHPEVLQLLRDREPSLDWLRRARGLEFPGVDYERASSSEGPVTLPDLQRVEDVCHVDQDRLSELNRSLRAERMIYALRLRRRL